MDWRREGQGGRGARRDRQQPPGGTRRPPARRHDGVGAAAVEAGRRPTGRCQAPRPQGGQSSAVGARLLRARHLRRLRSWTAADANLAAFYARFVRPGELCFDVGANRGNRTKVFLALGAHVVAVEPQGACADVLTAAYGRHPRVTVVRAALGAREGEAEMHIADNDVLSSLSPDWMRAVKASGRFPDEGWTASERVPLTTLDALASRYGAPKFVKIDVEGYELEVLCGMSALPACLSFELTIPECLDRALACIDALDALGDPLYNYSLGEAMHLELPAWVRGDALKARVEAADRPLFGDVFACREAPTP